MMNFSQKISLIAVLVVSLSHCSVAVARVPIKSPYTVLTDDDNKPLKQIILVLAKDLGVPLAFDTEERANEWCSYVKKICEKYYVKLQEP